MIFFQKNKKSTGELGEKAAENYLKKKNYKILERNFTNKTGRRLGEIDIIAEKNKQLIFVEVKTRRFHKGGKRSILPEENITSLKLRRLNKVAILYININKVWDMSHQFDAISVWMDEKDSVCKIKHIENIFI